jgi:phosphatidylglycerophosphatase A
MPEHKNKSRAPIKPFNVPTLALSVGGLGFLRPAPGTWGSMPPPAIAGLLLLFGAQHTTIYAALGASLVISSVACVLWGKYAEQRFGRKDAAEVVADETAGVTFACFVAIYFTTPTTNTIAALAYLAGAFLLFRIMDILKPAPARQLEKLPFGWGVLIDDLVAGVYAAIALALAIIAANAVLA